MLILSIPFVKKIYRLPGEYATHRARQLSEKGEEGLYGIMVSSALAFVVILLSPSNQIFTASLLFILFLVSAFYIRSLHTYFSDA